MLSNFLFKIITKVLANRLAGIANRIVSPHQFGFIRGRSIQDCIAGASECANLLDKKCFGGNVAMKVDIRKAFDTLRWSFLTDVLHAFGFSSVFCQWVVNILSSARVSILMNGSPFGYFSCSQGVRQGDPLSPILFGIAEDFLSRLILHKVSLGEISAMPATRHVSAPSHFLYADDILLFCRGNKSNVQKVISVFNDYGVLSNQHVSWDKSFIYFGSSIPAARQSALVRQVGMRHGSLPFVYLGVPIFKGKPKLLHLRPLVDRILMRFDAWSGKVLSYAGRLCLINSVITSLFVHSFLIYKWPASLISLLNKAIRNFLWTGNINTAAAVPVAWKVCTSPLKVGGLGIKNLDLFNDSLLSKLAWKVLSDSSFVHSFLRSRFQGKFNRNFYLTSSIWPSVRSMQNKIFIDCMWIVGLSSKVRFWQDNWTGLVISDFVDLTNEIWDPNLLVKDCVNSDGTWVLPNFLSNYPDVVSRISKICISSYATDILVWRPSSSGEVSCKQVYNRFFDSYPVRGWEHFIWSSSIPPSRSFLCWRVMLNRLPTDCALRRRGCYVVSRCALCQVSSETVEHLFISCPYALAIWDFIMSLFGKPLVLSGGLKELVCSAISVKLSPQLYVLWAAAIVGAFASIWFSRNRYVHAGVTIPISQALGFISRAIKEANISNKGTMFNTVDDLLILRKIGVKPLHARAPRIIPVTWKLPDPYWLKVNTDGAALGTPGIAGGGGVFRNSRGFVKGCFAVPFGVVSAFESELLAVIHALELAKDKAWDWIWLECDSKYVVDLIRVKSHKVPAVYRARWSHCLDFAASICFKVSHIYREGNQVADCLSKHALHLSQQQWWHSLPDFCVSAHKSDLFGPVFRFA